MGHSPFVKNRATALPVRLALAVVLAGALLALLPLPSMSHGEKKHTVAEEEAPASEAKAPAAEVTHEAHEHAEVAPAPEHPYPPPGVPRPLAWLGKFHPALTHFPVALLIVAAVAEFLFRWRPRDLFRHAVRFCVWTGAVGALLAAPLGWFFAGFQWVDSEWVMTAHRWLGTGTALWAVLLVVLCERVSRETDASRTGLRVALLAGALFASVEGFLGGSLIYGLGHYAW